MEKRIFEEQYNEPQTFQAKQEFQEENIEITLDNELEKTQIDVIWEESVKPPRFWLRLFLTGIIIFALATLAQSVQWLWESWQAHKWINVTLAIAALGICFAGIGALVNEWRKLIKLRYHQQQKQIGESFWLSENTSGEKAQLFCKERLNEMQQAPNIQQLAQRWQNEIQDGHNAKEIFTIFSQDVLQPLDQQAKQLITKSATENALIVAISPLAIVDMLFMAWRNIALVNKLAKLYGLELGYFSRLKLMKMVLVNMAFAGATELISDIGMDVFSQNLTAKFSMKAAQGFGVGILTARLGLKTMEFCRPITFHLDERPKLSVIRQELLSNLKTVIFSKEKATEKQEIPR